MKNFGEGELHKGLWKNEGIIMFRPLLLVWPLLWGGGSPSDSLNNCLTKECVLDGVLDFALVWALVLFLAFVLYLVLRFLRKLSHKRKGTQ